jgi:DNA-binding transcriptional ArsR family regulator
MIKRTVGATDQDLEQLTTLFRLLSDKTRLNILFALADGERNVSSLCDHLGLPQPTVSHHLGLLRMSNVISNRRNGKQVFYSLNGRVDVGAVTGIQIGVEKFSVKIAADQQPAMFSPVE